MAERGLYACPDCGEKGDVITATMRLERVSFRSAVARLQEGK
jgi:DNA primase